MERQTQNIRRHPDIFTAEEAAGYLGLPVETGSRTLETLRANYGLVGQKIGLELMYHRRNLDACADRIFGMAQQNVSSESRGPKLKIGAR